MEEKNKYLSAEETEIIKLIDKITKIILERKSIIEIGESGELLLTEMAEDKRIIYERAEGRYEHKQNLKNPDLTEAERNSLNKLTEAGKALDEATKNIHTGLEIMYYQLLNQSGKLPEA